VWRGTGQVWGRCVGQGPLVDAARACVPCSQGPLNPGAGLRRGRGPGRKERARDRHKEQVAGKNSGFRSESSSLLIYCCFNPRWVTSLSLKEIPRSRQSQEAGRILGLYPEGQAADNAKSAAAEAADIPADNAAVPANILVDSEAVAEAAAANILADNEAVAAAKTLLAHASARALAFADPGSQGGRCQVCHWQYRAGDGLDMDAWGTALGEWQGAWLVASGATDRRQVS